VGIVGVVAVAIAAIALWPSPSGLREKGAQIRKGMSREEVWAIVGEPAVRGSLYGEDYELFFQWAPIVPGIQSGFVLTITYDGESRWCRSR
jgi:hypothetical protein